MADNNIMSITNVKTVTIASGATGQSAEIDLTGFTLGAIVMPAAWTTANLTVLAATKTTADGGTYLPVYDEYGSEYVITASTSRTIVFPATPCALAPLRFIKLRSGTAATPVDQTTTRTLYLILKG